MSVDYEIGIGDYVIGVDIDHYHYSPPTGRCAQLCETPEDLYGDLDLEYTIKSIYREETGETEEGDDLDLPEGIEDGDLGDLVLGKINEGNEPDEDDLRGRGRGYNRREY